MYYVIMNSVGHVELWDGRGWVSMLGDARGYSDLGLAEYVADREGGYVLSEADVKDSYVIKEYDEYGSLVVRDIERTILYREGTSNRVRWKDLRANVN